MRKPRVLAAVGIAAFAVLAAALLFHRRPPPPPAPPPVPVAADASAISEGWEAESWTFQGSRQVEGFRVESYEARFGTVMVAATLVSDERTRVMMIGYVLSWRVWTERVDVNRALAYVTETLRSVSPAVNDAAGDLLSETSRAALAPRSPGGVVHRARSTGDGWIVESCASALASGGEMRIVASVGARRVGMKSLAGVFEGSEKYR